MVLVSKKVGAMLLSCDEERDLVVALVGGAFETPLWTTFLDGLRRATGSSYTTLIVRMPGRPFEEAISVLSGDSPWKIDEVYRDHFYPRDPVVDESIVEGRPYSLDELLGPPGAMQSGIYRDFLAQNGITAVRQMRVQDPSGIDAWLTITRRGDDYTAQDCTLLTNLIPVLRSVLRQYVTIERERFAASLNAEAIRRLQFGWVTLDASGRVLECDEQGAQVLAHSGVVSRAANGRLVASEPELEREIAQAQSQLIEDPLSRPHAVTLSRNPWLDMLLVPASRRASISTKARAAVIAYVHGDSWRSADRCEQLAELFRLSPREAQLALALCRGMTIAEAAEEFGLAVGTARNYSKAIYAKTGARGLPDLVRIVMRSVLAVAPDD